MRQACEVHTGDLRELAEARGAVDGCAYVVHLAAIVGGIGNFHKLPHTLLEANNALYNAVFRAALEQRVERLVYVSSSMVFERAEQFPTTEAYLDECRPRAPPTASPSSRASRTPGAPGGARPWRSRSAARSTPTGPASCPTRSRASRMVPDLISKVLSGQRPLEIFGSGEQTRTFTHVDDIADGIVTAMSSPAGVNDDFNISAAEEITITELARVIWEACGEDPAAFELKQMPGFEVDVQRRWPSVEKAREVLGWEARISVREGIARTVEWMREQQLVGR